MEEYIRQLEAEQEEEQITQHPKRSNTESGQTPEQRTAKENETIIALEVQKKKKLSEAQCEQTTLNRNKALQVKADKEEKARKYKA